MRPCEKVAYKTRTAARAAAPKHHGRPYRCPRCGMYHIGHKWKRKKYLAILKQRQRLWMAPLIEIVEKECGV